MSVVVGLVDNGEVYMGADSLCASLDGTWVREDAASKVARRGQFLIGIVGKCRVSDILFGALTAMQAEPDPDEYVRWNVVQQIRAALEIGGALKVKDGVESMEAEVLLGGYGRLFHIVSNFGVVEPKKYHAIGSGAQYALGALHVMDGENWLPSSKLSMAVEAAAAFSPFVGGCVNGLRLKVEEAA